MIKVLGSSVCKNVKNIWTQIGNDAYKKCVAWEWGSGWQKIVWKNVFYLKLGLGGFE